MRTNNAWMKAATAVQLAVAALVLTACGGGGSDEAVTPPVVVTPPAPASLTIGGTAAVGAALAGANVQIKCAGANGTATTATDGSYSVAITGASLPCVLSATSSDSKTVLRSVAEAGTATSVTANITPLSEIIVAQIAGGDAGALFTTFDAAAQAKLTTTALTDAKTTVSAALKGTVDLTGVDPLKDALVATGGGKTGNDLDKKLDALGAALKAGQTTVAEVAAAVVANPTAPSVTQTLLQPVASSCAALRSGTFQALDPYNTAAAVSKVKIDVAALTFTDAKGAVKTVTPVADNACAFTADNGTTKAYVAKSGVIVVRYAESASVSRAMLLVPDQTVPLAELAGTWNIAFYGGESFGSAAAPYYTVETLNASSLVTAGADCVGLEACKTWTPRATDIFTLSNEGGYAAADDEGSARVFAVKTPAGQIALFGMLFDTKKQPLGLLFFGKQAALTLPTVGQVDKFWDLEINYNGAKTPVDVQTTVKTVDTAAGSYTRERASDGRIDGFSVNKPRNGMRYRAAGSSVVTGGATVNFGEILTTPLPGMGLTVYSSLTTGANNFFGISVGKP